MKDQITIVTEREKNNLGIERVTVIVLYNGEVKRSFDGQMPRFEESVHAYIEGMKEVIEGAGNQFEIVRKEIKRGYEDE